MTPRLPLAAVLAVALAGAARAADGEAAPGAERIALDPLRAAGLPEGVREAVEDRICAALAEASKADVVCPSGIAAAALLAKQAVMFGECLPDECLRRVDAMRQADRRVAAALAQGERCLVLSLEITMRGGPGQRVLEKVPEDVDALLARVPDVVKKLFAEQ